jgi:lysophospholipase L1-like esterase
MAYNTVRALQAVRHNGVLRIPGQTSGDNAQDFVVDDTTKDRLVALGFVSLVSTGSTAPMVVKPLAALLGKYLDGQLVGLQDGAGNDVVLSDGAGVATVVFEGDSRTANGISATQGYTCYGYSSIFRALSKAKLRTINLGVSGNKAPDMYARLAQVASYSPWAVVRWCGVNDLADGVVGGGVTAANTIIQCSKFDLSTAGAKYSILVLETGFTGWAAAQVAEMLALNKALVAYAATDNRVRIVNAQSTAVDYTAAVQVPVTYLPGAFADGVHPAVAMSFRLGAAVATLIDSLWGAVDSGAVLMPGDSENLLVNPHFGSTQAINTGGFNGAIPASWFAYQTGLATVTASVQANALKPNMREVKFVITTTGTAIVHLWQDPLPGVVAGDNLVAAAEIEVVGTPVNLANAQFSLYSVIGGVTKYANSLFYSAGFDNAAPNSSWPQIPMTLQQPETNAMLIGAGVQTNLRADFTATIQGAGSATILMRLPYAKKVPAGYVR